MWITHTDIKQSHNYNMLSFPTKEFKVQNHRLFQVTGARGIAGDHRVECVSFRFEITFCRTKNRLLKAVIEEKLPDTRA